LSDGDPLEAERVTGADLIATERIFAVLYNNRYCWYDLSPEVDIAILMYVQLVK